MDLYERVKKVATEKGYSINSLEKELGYARSSISKFRNNTPSAEKISEIANCLGVSIDYLMNGEKSDQYYLDDESREMAEFLFNNPDYKVLFDASRKVKPEDIEFVKKMIERTTSGNQMDDTGC